MTQRPLRPFIRPLMQPFILGLVVGLTLLLPTSAFSGDDLPAVSSAPATTGEFDAQWRVEGSEEKIPFGTAGPQAIFRHQGKLTVLGHDGLVGNALSRCIGLRDARSGSMARCVWISDGGAQIFSEVERAVTANGQGGSGKGRIVGGTGRFAGITGSYELRWVEQPPASKGQIRGETVSMHGRWQIGGANTAR